MDSDNLICDNVIFFFFFLKIFHEMEILCRGYFLKLEKIAHTSLKLYILGISFLGFHLFYSRISKCFGLRKIILNCFEKLGTERLVIFFNLFILVSLPSIFDVSPRNISWSNIVEKQTGIHQTIFDFAFGRPRVVEIGYENTEADEIKFWETLKRNRFSLIFE